MRAMVLWVVFGALLAVGLAKAWSRGVDVMRETTEREAIARDLPQLPIASIHDLFPR